MTPEPRAARPGVLAVRSSRDPGRLAALRAEWSALFDAASDPSPFLSPEWLEPWWRAFGGRREPWILEARDGAGALAGLLLLAGRTGPLGLRRFSLLGNGVTGADGLDVLARAGDAPAVREAIARAIAQEADGWDVLDLEDLPCGSPTVGALMRATGARGARAAVERGFVCPGFAVTGTFAGHLAGVRRRETYGRRVRWLARHPGFRVEVATTPAQAPAALEHLLRLHRLRWAAEGGSDGIPPGPVEDFHREVVPRLAARGWLRLYVLHVEGAAIAAVYGIEARGRFSYYQSGYDPAWSARSPGLVLVGRTVEDAYSRGLRDYDFLRGTEPYKLDWARDRRETCTLRLLAPSLRAGTAALARDAWRGARSAARAIAPAGVWEALRRARRGLAARSLAPARAGGGRAMLDRASRDAKMIVRRVAKTAAAGALVAAGAHRALRALRQLQAPGPRVLLLSYHRATLDFAESAREGLPSMLVSARTLRRQLEQLARGWEIVSVSQAARILAEGPRGPGRAFAAVTFDDGYADNHAVALPVLAALRIPATVYVATAFTGTSRRLAHDRLFATLRELVRRGTPFERAGLEPPLQALLTACAARGPAATLDRLIARLPHPRLLAVAEALEARTGIAPADLPASTRLLDWDELREMAAAGLEVGGHSVSHAVLPNLPLGEVRREIEGCRAAIAERLGRPPCHFAYPNGFHSPSVRRAVREAGFETGSTTEDRENVRGCDPFALRRKVLWESSTLGPLGYSAALAACSFEGVFSALRLSRAVPGERPDRPEAAPAEALAPAEERAAS